jgi:hypothetical protein
VVIYMPEEWSRPVHRWTPAEVDLAIEALDIASAAVRRLMRISGAASTAIETQSKSMRRLAARLRRGGEIKDKDAAFVAGALEIAAVLHRSAGAARGRRGDEEAEAFARAARVFAPGAPSEHRLTIWPDQAWPIGERVVEIATGKAFWIDDYHSARHDLIGVIPDEGAPTLQWRSKPDFIRPALEPSAPNSNERLSVRPSHAANGLSRRVHNPVDARAGDRVGESHNSNRKS